MKKQVNKPYHQYQPRLIPLNLEELMGSEHLVRHFDEVINRIDMSVLEKQYLGGGTSAYQPVMLLKVTL